MRDTIEVPVELVRELKSWKSTIVPVRLIEALRKLPDPPKPDPFKGCDDAVDDVLDGGVYTNRRLALAVIRAYIAAGSPELPE